MPSPLRPPGGGLRAFLEHHPGGTFHALVDLDEAAALMRRVYETPDEARRVGERARVDLARGHSPAARAVLLGLEALGRIRRERMPRKGPG